MLEQRLIIRVGNSYVQGTRHCIEAVIHHYLFGISFLLQSLAIRLVEVVFELDSTAIQLQINCGRYADREMGSVKVFCGHIIRFASQQERDDLRHRRKRITCCNNTDIENAIIDIGSRSQFYDISIFARIANNHLQSFTFPEELTITSATSTPYFYGNGILFSNFPPSQ